MQGIALECPAKGPSDAVPVTPEAIDATGAIGVGRVAGASQRLPFEDTEPDFDLIQPRGMQRQKLEVHPARLQAEPRANFGSSVNGQVVEDNDQSAALVISVAVSRSVASVRAQMATRTPSCASFRATAMPMPSLPPVTSAALPPSPRSIDAPPQSSTIDSASFGQRRTACSTRSRSASGGRSCLMRSSSSSPISKTSGTSRAHFALLSQSVRPTTIRIRRLPRGVWTECSRCETLSARKEAAMSTVPTPTTTLPLDEINLASMDFWLRDDVEGALAKLRHERPIAWHQHPDSGKGFWSI